MLERSQVIRTPEHNGSGGSATINAEMEQRFVLGLFVIVLHCMTVGLGRFASVHL